MHDDDADELQFQAIRPAAVLVSEEVRTQVNVLSSQDLLRTNARDAQKVELLKNNQRRVSGGGCKPGTPNPGPETLNP